MMHAPSSGAMPRRSRLELPGIPPHITQRGVNRAAVFVDDAHRQHSLGWRHDLIASVPFFELQGLPTSLLRQMH